MFTVGSLEEESFDFIKKMMKKYKIEKEVFSRMDPYLTRALRCLEGLPETPEKDFLRNFVSFVADRDS